MLLLFVLMLGVKPCFIVSLKSVAKFRIEAEVAVGGDCMAVRYRIGSMKIMVCYIDIVYR